ncbi:protein of unknown function [Rhodovastum atsumiense]|nr:protein of unknown function [Rhodovastum atsumiense]
MIVLCDWQICGPDFRLINRIYIKTIKIQILFESAAGPDHGARLAPADSGRALQLRLPANGGEHPPGLADNTPGMGSVSISVSKLQDSRRHA